MQISLEKDPEMLRWMAQALDAENQRLTKKNVALQKENLALKGMSPDQLQQKLQLLEEQLAQARQQMFGKSSEKRPSEKCEPVERAPQVGHGHTEQPALPIVDQVHLLDEADKICPQCGGDLKEWNGQFEESEEIDVIERKFIVRKHRRQKYRCECQACVETAPLPEKLFPGARYSIDFAIDVAVGKYADHLPLERQARMMNRDGLLVTSQTLWDQIDALAVRLARLHRALHGHVLAQPVVGADETRWPLLGKRGEAAGASKWHAWAVTAPDAVCYLIENSRSTEAAKNLLADFSGVVIADGYSAYESLRQQRKNAFVLAHCWAHVRRKFVKIEKFYPVEATKAIALIGELYAIDAQSPRGSPGEELRQKLRHEKSREVIEKIRVWAESMRTLPQSSLGKAIAYMTKLWPGLVRFLDDARIPLDNNATERAERGVVVGRKNHYGSKSRRGTEVAALFYSIIETCKLVGLEPRAYLRSATLAAIRGEPLVLPHQVA